MRERERERDPVSRGLWADALIFLLTLFFPGDSDFEKLLKTNSAFPLSWTEQT